MGRYSEERRSAVLSKLLPPYNGVVKQDLNAYNRFLRTQLLVLSCVDHVQTSFALVQVLSRSNLPLEHLR